MIEFAKIHIPNFKLVSIANKHVHWTKMSGYNNFIKKTVFQHWLTNNMHLCPFSLPLHIKLIRHGRRLDDDNLISSFKTVRDQIAALILEDHIPGHADSDKRLTWSYDQTQRLMPKQDSITITFYKNRYGDNKIPC